MVVIKEGATVVDIDRIMAAAGIIRPGELIDYNSRQDVSLEGFLFPDTYGFAAGSLPETVARVMKENFDAHIGPLVVGRLKSEWYGDLVIASLVEKEAVRPRDQALAAGVIRRRLRLGMPIQIDAALVYAKCNGAYMTCSAAERLLTRADLAIASPYNNYLRAGLPPAPIANPGLAAFTAVANAEKSSYLYYISDPKTGNLIFASTLDEHNNNRKKYHVN